MENLKRWNAYLYDMFSNLIVKLPYDKQQEMRDKIENYLKLYEDVQLDEEGNVKNEPLTQEQIDLKKQLSLKEGVLKSNCGVPTIIIVNKVRHKIF
jgi:hypothetical protein